MEKNYPLIMLAPMDGWTDYALRRTIAEDAIYKPDRFFTEFVNVEALDRDILQTKRILLNSTKDKPISAQLFGKNPDKFYLCSKKLILQGYRGIDINMGCPARNVTHNQEGAFLIKNKDTAGKIIEACTQAVSESKKNVTLSVKTRLGYEKDITEEWIFFLNKYKLDFITLHGRTYTQAYMGKANWDRIAKAAEISKISIIGNGDVESIEQANEFIQKYQLDGVMIGRNFTAFLSDKIEDRIRSLIKYLEYSYKYISPYYNKSLSSYNNCKKICLSLLKGYDNCKQIKEEIVNATEYRTVIEYLKSSIY